MWDNFLYATNYINKITIFFFYADENSWKKKTMLFAKKISGQVGILHSMEDFKGRSDAKLEAEKGL